MSRLLYQAELPRRAPNRNRTDDLFLTMETLYRLSYGGGSKMLFPFGMTKTTTRVGLGRNLVNFTREKADLAKRKSNSLRLGYEVLITSL